MRRAAILLCLLPPLGRLLFALPRVAPGALAVPALLWGFLYGLVLYGRHDLTSYPTLAGWPFLRLSFAGMARGGVLCALLTRTASQWGHWLR